MFPHAKEILSAIWARSFKNICQPSRMLQKFKEYGFEGVPNYLLAPGAYGSWTDPPLPVMSE
jgi:hypothetical protein